MRSRLIGHKSTRMLEAHYRHPVRATFNGQVDHIEAMFGAG